MVNIEGMQTEGKVDLLAIQDAMGWSSLQCIKTYLHLSQNNIDHQREIVSKYLTKV